MAVSTLVSGSTSYGQVLKCTKGYTAQKITNIALDGTPYVQTTGTATDRRSVSVYCKTREKREALDAASNNGTLLIIKNWLGNDIRGYIEKDVSWQQWRDEHGVGSFTLMVKEVVASETS